VSDRHSITDSIGIPIPPEFKFRCCGLTGDDVKPEEAELVEAVMILGRIMVDENDKAVMFRVPPAYALALLRALKEPNPLWHIRKITDQEQRRQGRRFPR